MSSSKYKYGIYLSFIILFGLIIRYVPFLKELQDSPILFYQPDNLYYVRRALCILYNFPHIPNYDLYLTYPTPVDFPSPPFYPFLIAFLSWIIGLGSPSAHTVELVSSAITAISGAFIALPIYNIFCQISEKKYALFAAFLSTFMPLHYWYTNAIDGDHHALETFLALTTFSIYLGFFEQKLKKNVLLFIIALTALFCVWQGAILYAGFITFFTVLYFICVDRDLDIIKYVGISFVLSACILIILMVLVPPYKVTLDFGRYSYFSPLSLLFCGLFLSTLFSMLEKKGFILIINVFLLLLLFLILKNEIIKGFSFLFRQEKGYVSVLEMQSIFKVSWWKGVIDLDFLLKNIFFFYLIFPLFIAYFALVYPSRKLHFVAFLIIFFAVLTYIQRRFGYVYGPLIALFFPYALSRLKRKIPYYAVVIAIFFVVTEWGVSVGKTKTYFSMFIERQIKDAYSWLSENTPLPSDSPFKTDVLPNYAVFAPWHQGYFLVYYGKRPVIANNALMLGGMENFIDNLKLTITNNEQTFMQLLDKYKIRYLAILATTYERSTYEFLGHPYMEPLERIYGVLDFNYGIKNDTSLERFRLIGEFVGNKENKRIKIYEYVKGAHVSFFIGKGKEAFLMVKPQTSYRKFIFKINRKADDNGYVHFTLPYSAKQGQIIAPPYELAVDNSVIKFFVTEDAILNGKKIIVKDIKKKKEGVVILE